MIITKKIREVFYEKSNIKERTALQIPLYNVILQVTGADVSLPVAKGR